MGWCKQPKGLLQILWERGYIDEDAYRRGKYSLNGKSDQKDANGVILPEFKKYIIHNLMDETTDFRSELSSIGYIMKDLTTYHGQDFQLKISPKYHCEIAGEGIEYCWGMSKIHYRMVQLSDKSVKEKFDQIVKESVKHVTKENARLFSARARRYMLAYTYLQSDNTKMTYCNIEKMVSDCKVHRSMLDKDTGFFERSMEVQQIRLDSYNLNRQY